MARKDRDYDNRMAGYIAAYNKVKTEGIEALEKDLKMRNILKIDISVPESKAREYFDELSSNLYANTMTSVAWTLHHKFGFGRKRIQDFKKYFDETVMYAMDLDYLGEHYVKLEDFALELNKMYDLGIDYTRVAVCQDLQDEANPNYRMCKIDRVLNELRNQGFHEAAKYIDSILR